MTGEETGPLHVSVALPIPLRQLFTYEVEPAQRARISLGARVRVPLGKRKTIGTVVDLAPPAPGAAIELRPIEAILEDTPSATGSILELTRFVADYYLCSWGEAIEAALPPEAPGAALPKVVARVPGAVAATLSERATAQRKVFEALPADGSPVPLGRLGERGRRAVAHLERSGHVQVFWKKEPEPRAAPSAPEPPPEPTPAQARVLSRVHDAIGRGTYAPHLLYGATGSGKTEVYLRAAEATLAAGRGVLYLVPEIGLTALLVSRIERRFPGQVAVLHSALSARERLSHWERIRSGRCRFAVGARSAIFAPLQDPGLVVVDEEQDGSYKQQDAPRYNARDLAVVRAREAGAVLLLGSATPSLESFHHARSGRYALLELGGRVEDRPLARVKIVDMREEFKATGKTPPLSRALKAALVACVARGEQALVLRNRRGWAVALLCPTCGNRVTCSRCSVALTWHEAARRLRCHYCGLELPHPKLCPSCGGLELRQVGEGSERIEDELKALLPDARIARMDRDTVRRRGAHEALLRRFDRGEIDVLVGTQMIAKGHDFPRVTLVGVLSADQTLGLPDFRAAERAFQLLTQVAGRAGRGTMPGEVVVQAFDPTHPVLGQAARQDYAAFYEHEIRYRRALRYPPLTALVQIMIVDRNAAHAADWAERVADAIRREGEGKLLLTGPGPAPIERIDERYRMQILVRSAGRRRLVNAVGRALDSVAREVPARAIQVDVDPVSLL